MRAFAGLLQFALFIVSVVTTEPLSGQQTAAPQLPGITGRIVDAVGCPLIVALKLRPDTAPFVEGSLQDARSDMDGRFAFTNVAPGRYWIHYDLTNNGGWGGDGVVVTAAGAHKEFRWPAPRKNPRDFKDRTFIVTDADGDPIAGAHVSWRRFSGAIGGPSCGEDTTTNGDGRATASESPPGTYRVVIDGNGYVRQSRDVKFESGHSDTLTVRLLTPAEAERASRTVHIMCGSSHGAPDTLPEAAARADAIVVGRVVTAGLDPDYSASETQPTVLTRYDVQVLDVIKLHARLATHSQHIRLAHFAGELDWGNQIVVGCDHYTMRPGETFALFLIWNDRMQAFTPMSGNALLANLTSGEVRAIRASYTPGPIVTAATGHPAAKYVESLKRAVGTLR